MFFGGIPKVEQRRIIQIIHFSVGKLLMKYLGVLLVTKKISVADCKPLSDRVTSIVLD